MTLERDDLPHPHPGSSWRAWSALADRRRSDGDTVAALHAAERAFALQPQVSQVVVDRLVLLAEAGDGQRLRTAVVLAAGTYFTARQVRDLVVSLAGAARKVDLLVLLASSDHDFVRALLPELRRDKNARVRSAVSSAARMLRFLDPQGAASVDEGSASDRDLYQAARVLWRQGEVVRPATILRHLQHVRGPETAPVFDAVETAESLLLQGFAPRLLSLPPGRWRERPERTLYLLHNSLPWHSAGYAARTHGLLTGLQRHGEEVEGITRINYPFDILKDLDPNEVPAEDVVDGIRYSRLLPPPDGLLKTADVWNYASRYADALVRRMGERDADILHAASNFWNGLAASTAARATGAASVYEVRGLWEVTRASRDAAFAGSDRYLQSTRLEAEAAGLADHCIAITHALKDEMVSRGVPPDHITVVPNGVDVTRFRTGDRDHALADELGVGDDPVIGYVGSLLDYEGLDLLIDAFAELRREGSPARLLVVGDGPVRGSLEDQAQRAGVGAAVVFTGRVPHHEVERYYSLVDVAPFPRLPLPVCEMVSPLKPFEAMAMEKAVVVSSVAALTEIVTDGRTGRVFVKGDASDLARVLHELVEDEHARVSLARAGAEWVRRERDWSLLSGEVQKIYRRLRRR